MAWIKLESHTPDKTEVFQMANILGIESDDVVGKCCRVWAWFDLNTIDGVTDVTVMLLLDRYTCSGFCDAMVTVGWMIKEGNTLSLPNYDYHNSQTAKDRAQSAKRMAKMRNNSVTSTVTKSEQNCNIDKIREDKKRLDKNIININECQTNDRQISDGNNYPLINSLLPILSKLNKKSFTDNEIFAYACETTLQKVKALTGDANFISEMEQQINWGNNPVTIKNSVNPVKDLNVYAGQKLAYLLKGKEIEKVKAVEQEKIQKRPLTPWEKADIDAGLAYWDEFNFFRYKKEGETK